MVLVTMLMVAAMVVVVVVAVGPEEVRGLPSVAVLLVLADGMMVVVVEGHQTCRPM
jgi:hypothetical protein